MLLCFRRPFVAVSALMLAVACGSVSGAGEDEVAGSADGGASAGGGAGEGGRDSPNDDAGAGGKAGASSLTGAGGASEAGAGGAFDSAPVAEQAGAAGSSAQLCPSRFATSVVSFIPGTGAMTGQDKLPGIVLGPPQGGGATNGSLDVATLGNGGQITLGFAPSEIVDGPGPDFIVFENPFDVGGDPTKPFAELATVAVSEDGKTFHAFPCTATAYPYGMCAGWHPVFANAVTNQIDPTDPAVAGGDAFDLADIGVSRARFVRITDRVDQTGLAGTFDLDAVSIVHAECP